MEDRIHRYVGEVWFQLVVGGIVSALAAGLGAALKNAYVVAPIALVGGVFIAVGLHHLFVKRRYSSVVAARFIKGKRVRLVDLADAYGVISNKTIEDCDIEGPGVLILYKDSADAIDPVCTFGPPGVSMGWCVAIANTDPVGSIRVLKGTYFKGCRFNGVGLVSDHQSAGLAPTTTSDPADRILVAELSIEDHRLSQANPCLQVHFTCFNGSAFPIRLAAPKASGHVHFDSAFLPGEFELESNPEVVNPGQLMAVTASLFVSPADAHRLSNKLLTENCLSLTFLRVGIPIQSDGDSTISQLRIPRTQIDIQKNSRHQVSLLGKWAQDND